MVRVDESVTELELSGDLFLWVSGTGVEAVRSATEAALGGVLERPPSMCVVSELPGGLVQVQADFKDDEETAQAFCMGVVGALGEVGSEAKC